MFGIGAQELIVVLLIALVIFGPKKLPEAARQIGNLIGKFKRASDDAMGVIRKEIDFINNDEPAPSIKPSLNSKPKNKINDDEELL